MINQISKKYLLVVILCLVTTQILNGASTTHAAAAVAAVKVEPVVVKHKPASTSTLSPAQELVEAIKTDAKGFQNIQDLIDGKTHKMETHAPTPTAPPVVKKQINLAVEKTKDKPSAKKVLENDMAEIEKINLLDTPSAPNSVKSNKVPAAQSIPVSSGSARSSSSSSSESANNGKIIGSAVGGGLLCVALVVGTVFAIVHTKRKRKNTNKESTAATDITDEAGYGGIEEDVE